MLPLHNIDALLGGMYQFAGNMITDPVIQVGQGFPLLSPALYCYLYSQDLDHLFRVATTDDQTDVLLGDAAR